MEHISKRAKLAIITTVIEDFTDPTDWLVIMNLFANYQRLRIVPSLLLKNEHWRLPDFYEKWIEFYLDYDFYLHFRLSKQSFKILHEEISVSVPPQHRNHPTPVTLEKAILITLWYLGKGETMLSVGDRFNIVSSTVYYVLSAVFKYANLIMDKYIKWPSEGQCVKIAENFYKKANFPGVIGAIDGCHFKCKTPVSQQDSYQDRYFQHSISIQAICTAEMILTNVSTGYPGSLHDARILRESNLHRKIMSDGYKSVFYNNEYHIVGDSAYPCKIWLMTPYKDRGNLSREKRRYNFLHSQTRVVIEHTFGQLKGRWVILKYINVYSIERAVDIINTCCFLHNFCLINKDYFKSTSSEINPTSTVNTLLDDHLGTEKRDNICALLNS